MKPKILIATIVCLFFAVGPAFGQGALTPPGVPAPTMKSLDQIEPRTPIFTLPYTISVPGSYYLATNTTVIGNAISVTTNDVTLDLNGFTITGDGSDVHYGVYIAPFLTHLRNITVRNGKLVNSAGVIVGIAGADNVLIEGMQVYTNARVGIWIEGTCVGAIIKNNLIVGGSAGIGVTAFTNAPVSGVTIIDNRICNVTSYGINIHGQDAATADISILNNQVTQNYISVSTVGVGTVSRVLIDGNHVTRTSALGMIVPANAKTTVIRNVLAGCTYSVNATGNTVGPIVTTVGTLGTSGADMSPWANFQN